MPAIQRLRQWAQGLKRADPTAATDAPLLGPADILDLLARLQKRSNPHPEQDAAHRQLGDARSPYRGQGLDFEENRAYQPGDDIRHMNWRLSARSGELQMKVFREERRPGVCILLDRRAAMRFGTRRRLKVTQAARAAAIATFAATRRSASVAGVILQKGPHWLDAATGEQAAFELIHHAAAPCPPQVTTTHEPGLGDTLRQLQVQLISGSTVYLISDFIDLTEQDRPALLQLASGNRLHAIHIHDPAERALPNAGPLRFMTPNGGTDVTLNTADPAVRAVYESAAASHFEQCASLLHGPGISYHALATDEDAVQDRVPLS